MKTGSVTFRRASTGDLETIVALLADDPIGRGRENLGPQLDNSYREAFAAIERDRNQLLAVAERSGDIIGVLQLSFIPGLTRRGMWRGQIEGVRVAGHKLRVAVAGGRFRVWVNGRSAGAGKVGVPLEIAF